MDKVFIQYSSSALLVREAINVALAVFTLVLCGLFGKYAATELRRVGYRSTGWPVKLSMGLFFMCAGEFLRASTIWEIIHYEGEAGTYLTDVGILLVSLFLIILGALCVIRVMTPAKWGNSIWIWSLAVVVALIGASRVL